MDQVILDKSGTMRTNVFYHLRFEADEDFLDQDDKRRPGARWASRRPGKSGDVNQGYAAFWRELETDEQGRVRKELIKDCPADPSHVTQEHQKVPMLRPGLEGRLADVAVSPVEMADILVSISEPLATRLKATPLRGYELPRVTMLKYGAVHDLEIDASSPLRLFELRIRGRNCLRPWKIVGAPNACIHCGFTPLFCEACGRCGWSCPKCHETVCLPRKALRPGDKALIVADDVQERIVDLKRWDGSDFCYETADTGWQIVTKRVVDWLEKHPRKRRVDRVADSVLRRRGDGGAVANVG